MAIHIDFSLFPIYLVGACFQFAFLQENFEDALELHAPSGRMDLSTAIEETRVALNLFLNNRFELAKEKMEPW